MLSQIGSPAKIVDIHDEYDFLTVKLGFKDFQIFCNYVTIFFWMTSQCYKSIIMHVKKAKNISSIPVTNSFLGKVHRKTCQWLFWSTQMLRLFLILFSLSKIPAEANISCTLLLPMLIFFPRSCIHTLNQ